MKCEQCDLDADFVISTDASGTWAANVYGNTATAVACRHHAAVFRRRRIRLFRIAYRVIDFLSWLDDGLEWCFANVRGFLDGVKRTTVRRRGVRLAPAPVLPMIVVNATLKTDLREAIMQGTLFFAKDGTRLTSPEMIILVLTVEGDVGMAVPVATGV